jgi:hypothetical protein
VLPGGGKTRPRRVVRRSAQQLLLLKAALLVPLRVQPAAHQGPGLQVAQAGRLRWKSPRWKA